MEQVLYSLPDGWEWRQLNDVVAKTENLSPLKHADQQWTYIDISSVDRERFTVTDPKEILGKDAPSRAKKHVQLNDVIFATTRPNLKNIALIRDEYRSPVASTGFCVLRANEKVLPAYLFYFVTTDFVQSQIEPYVGGASYPAITDDNLKKAPIPIPSVEEQKRIVEKLDTLLTRIDNVIEHLLESVALADLLYASELNEIFNPRSAPINQSGTYELPHGWEWQELADVVVKTKNLNPLKHPDQLWTYIDISSVDRDRFTVKDPKEVLGKDAPSRAKKHVQLNDVIFATTRPNLKNIALVRDEYRSPVASTGFSVLRANEKVLPAYLFYFVITDFVQEQIEPYVGGASYPAITDRNLKKALIPIPSIEEQNRIVGKINSIGKLQVALKEQLQFKISSLGELKASILDSAFKGEL